MRWTDYYDPRPQARPMRSASAWLAFVNANRPADRPGVTPWFGGEVHPVRTGWYERQFTDGVYRQWWDGEYWRNRPSGTAHWRQVGDYPCWRGLAVKAPT
jgi:hypothetical protein